MGQSAKIYFRTDHVKTDGTSAISMQVLIDRHKKIFPLDISWQADRLDKKKGIIKSRGKDDPDFEDYRIIINDALAKANSIFKYYRLTGNVLTMEKFTKDWQSGHSKESFIKYFKQKVKERLKDEIIGYSTYQNHLKTLTKLESWKDDILFADMGEMWGYDFDAFLKRDIKTHRGDSTNTRWAHHKNIKVYLKLATKDGIGFENPYQYFRISLIDSSWEAMHERDVIKLMAYYRKTENHQHKVILRRFLFACTTGLRVSDLYRVHSDWYNNGMMKFIPYKTRKSNKKLEIPLSSIASRLFMEALSEKGEGKLFNDVAEQYSNQVLKKIAKKLGIRVNLHHHVGRHTFITLYLKNGGNIEMAQELAGHSDIRTTQAYDHISEERKKNEIRHIDKIINYLEES